MLIRFILKIIAKIAKVQIYAWAENPIKTQKSQLKYILEKAKNTKFGIDHNFSKIFEYKDFKSRVPIRDYEDLKEYIELIKQGEANILWPGKPIYFAVTSGTTSGAKHIPITKHSLKNHLSGPKNALLLYIAQTGKTKFIKGNYIFIQGSPILTKTSGILTGRLSGISAHHVPFYMKKNMHPKWETNTINNWEEKVDNIVKETIDEDMTIISGIPSWVQMYFEKIVEKTNKKLSVVFPNFNLLVYGGVSFEPYKKRFKNLIGKNIDSIELFPASEGFFAFQDKQDQKDLLLILNSGIFYEFIEEQGFKQNEDKRISLSGVEKNKNYVMIISTSAGLWGYNTGDTVKFTSLKPYRIIVTGRITQSLSAFGEHVILKEAELSIEKAIYKTGLVVKEFTVAPQFKSQLSPACHEWFIEFEDILVDTKTFAKELDIELRNQNKYYRDLIEGKIIAKPKIKKIEKDGFKKYMKSIGKLGGQNKIPKISSNRKIADQLYKLNLVISN